VRAQIRKIVTMVRRSWPSAKALGRAALYVVYALFSIWRVGHAWSELTCHPNEADVLPIVYAAVTTVIVVVAIKRAAHYTKLSIRRAKHIIHSTRKLRESG
jgi:hypothetical protein